MHLLYLDKGCLAGNAEKNYGLKGAIYLTSKNAQSA